MKKDEESRNAALHSPTPWRGAFLIITGLQPGVNESGTNFHASKGPIRISQS